MNWKNILFYGMIVIIIGLAVYLIWFTKTEAYQCMISPMTYGIKHLSSSSGGNITCSCFAQGSPQGIIVTKDNMTYSDSYSRTDFNIPVYNH